MSTGLENALLAIDGSLVDGHVHRDPSVLEAHAHDESDAPAVLPGAVIEVTSASEIAAVLRAASACGVPVTPRAAGTGRVGGAVPSAGGIVLSMARMNRILTVDADNQLAVVAPGVTTRAVQEAAAEAGLMYAPDPNSAEWCTIGGNVATNAGGPRAFKYGVTREHVLGLEVVTASGEVLRTGRRTRKGVTGYDITALLVGSEGTLGVVSEATLRLVPLPEAIGTLLVLLSAASQIAPAVRALANAGVAPRCIELLDERTLEVLRPDAKIPIPTNAKAMLIVELDGDEAGLDSAMERVGNAMVDAGALDVLVAREGSERDKLWNARKVMSRTIRSLARHKMSEDVVVPPAHLAALLDRVREIGDREKLRLPAYGHAGDGNLHVNFLWDDDGERARVNRGIETLFEDVIALGGTLSGEHGLGTTKAPYLHLEQSDALIALQRRIKDAFDPAGILNPGKVLPATTRHDC
jgi:glycolate oxidase